MGDVRKMPLADLTSRVAEVLRHAVRITDEGRLDLLQLLDAMPACIAYCDASLRYRFVNRTYEDWFDVRREDVLGRSVPEFLGQAVFEALRPWIDRVLAGEPVRFTTTLAPTAAGARTVLASYVPHTGEDGRVAGYFALVQDLAEDPGDQAARRASRTMVD